MYPIQFPVAIKGCSSHRACFYELVTSMEQNFLSPVYILWAIKFTHISNFRCFFEFSFSSATAAK